MEYRSLGNTGCRASRLGFGALRLPKIRFGDAEYVDFDRATEVIHEAFRLGINYVDMGLMYCNSQSEIAVGRALRQWPASDEIILVTKATRFQINKAGDLRRMLEHQLQRLERDWIHFYLFHGIGWDDYHETERQTGWFGDMMRARDEGLVRHVGFSFHDKPERMKDLIDLGWAELVTCQYNYLDQRNIAAMAYAAEKGVAVAVMGPVGGGRLAVAPRGVDEALKISNDRAAELALRFVFSNPHVDVALSGMSSEEMARQNVSYLEKGPLGENEIHSLNAIMGRLGKLAERYCTGCEYCMPCPSNVNIPRCFELYNYHTIYGLEEYAEEEYAKLIKEGRDAARCSECEACLERCPQHLPIPQQLEEVDRLFAGDA